MQGFLQDKNNHLPDDTKERLSLFSIDEFNKNELLEKLDTITELESTGESSD